MPDDCDFTREQQPAIDAGGYPPDGVPYASVESLAEAYGQCLGYGGPSPMHALHLAAWGVLTGVVSRQQAADALKQAFDRTTDPTGRVVELRRLLTPIFAAAGHIELIVVAQQCQLPATAGCLSMWPAAAGVELLARRICQALDGRGDVLLQAAIVAAAAVEAGRIAHNELWGLVAEAKRLNAETPRLAFWSLVYWIERLRLRPAPTPPAPPPVVHTAADVEQLYRWLQPSVN